MDSSHAVMLGLLDGDSAIQGIVVAITSLIALMAIVKNFTRNNSKPCLIKPGKTPGA